MTSRPGGMTQDEFTDLRYLGDQLEGELKNSFYRMVGAAQQYQDRFAGIPNLLNLIESGNSAALYAFAERLISQGLIPNSLQFMNVMLAIMLKAGNATLASATLSLPVKDSIIESIKHFAMQRGKQEGGQWVTGISLDTAEGMRLAMLDAIKRGISVEQLGRELRGSIGLLPKHETAWLNYNDLLRSEKVSEKTFDRLSRMYYRRLLAYRATMIARTESMFAVHAGMLAGWEAQVMAGLIQPERTWIEWMVLEDDRLCDRCAPMDGKRIRFGGVFEFYAHERGFPNGKPPNVDSPYDRRMARRGPLRPKIPVSKAKPKPAISVFHPPLHPNCRCTLRLRFEL